jgi:hypothetical protein
LCFVPSADRGSPNRRAVGEPFENVIFMGHRVVPHSYLVDSPKNTRAEKVFNTLFAVGQTGPGCMQQFGPGAFCQVRLPGTLQTGNRGRPTFPRFSDWKLERLILTPTNLREIRTFPSNLRSARMSSAIHRRPNQRWAEWKRASMVHVSIAVWQSPERDRKPSRWHDLCPMRRPQSGRKLASTGFFRQFVQYFPPKTPEGYIVICPENT